MAGGDGDDDDNGWNPVKGLKKLVSNPVDTIVSTAVNVGSMGLVGYEDGQLTKGVLTRGADETIGELTGRNSARKAAMTTEDNLRAAQQQQADENAFELQRREAQERQQSGAILARQRRMQNTADGTLGSADDVEASLSTQFLGL